MVQEYSPKKSTETEMCSQKNKKNCLNQKALVLNQKTKTNKLTIIINLFKYITIEPAYLLKNK